MVLLHRRRRVAVAAPTPHCAPSVPHIRDVVDVVADRGLGRRAEQHNGRVGEGLRDLLLTCRPIAQPHPLDLHMTSPATCAASAIWVGPRNPKKIG